MTSTWCFFDTFRVISSKIQEIASAYHARETVDLLHRERDAKYYSTGYVTSEQPGLQPVDCHIRAKDPAFQGHSGSLEP